MILIKYINTDEGRLLFCFFLQSPLKHLYRSQCHVWLYKLIVAQADELNYPIKHNYV